MPGSSRHLNARRPSSHAQGGGPRLVCRASIGSHLRATVGFSATWVHLHFSRTAAGVQSTSMEAVLSGRL